MAKKNKYYVVWEGVEPGVYDNWTDAQLQILHYPGAKFKSYATQEEAVKAFRGNPDDELGLMRAILKRAEAENRKAVAPKLPEGVRDYTVFPEINLNAISVDGACSGNPGKMEYRAVRVIDGAELFRKGADGSLTGTNNIAEYLAIIHLAAILQKNNDSLTPIYTDSKNTLNWLRKGRSNTSLPLSPATEKTLALLKRADAWLAANGPIRNPILKWKTDLWGEIPADFGRK